jgi:tripartite-type tricarboxylate transporter receptor subunit TctC
MVTNVPSPVLRRRTLLSGALTTAALSISGARAAGYPAQDIKFIVPYGAGGGFDLYVRTLAPAMQKLLPNPVQIVPDNVPAGGGVLGIGQLYRARPDGYTIGVLNIPGMFVLQQGGGGSFDLRRFSWIGSIGRDNYAIAVGADSPLRSIADLKALSAKRAVKFTTTGREGTAFSATVIAMSLLGIRTQMITGYKGSSDYVVAAIRGDGDAVVATMPLLNQMVAGKLMRVLATFEAQSSMPGAEDATTLGQPELSQIVLERLVAAPPKVTPETLRILADALGGALGDPAVIAWAQKAGAELRAVTPEQAAALVDQQAAFYDKWKTVLAPS